VFKGETTIVSVRMTKNMYVLLKDIAGLESIQTGNIISVQELIRNALSYVYSDNERLRECFRRSRRNLHNRFN
jgi:hypothetical protein